MRAYLAAHRQRQSARGLAVDARVVNAPATDAILQAVRAAGTVRVMSTHRRGGWSSPYRTGCAAEVTRAILLIRVTEDAAATEAERGAEPD